MVETRNVLVTLLSMQDQGLMMDQAKLLEIVSLSAF